MVAKLYLRVDSGGEFPGLKTTVFGHFWAVSGAYPGRPGVATFLPLNYHWSTLLHMEVVRSVAPHLHFSIQWCEKV